MLVANVGSKPDRVAAFGGRADFGPIAGGLAKELQMGGFEYPAGRPWLDDLVLLAPFRPNLGQLAVGGAH